MSRARAPDVQLLEGESVEEKGGGRMGGKVDAEIAVLFGSACSHSHLIAVVRARGSRSDNTRVGIVTPEIIAYFLIFHLPSTFSGAHRRVRPTILTKITPFLLFSNLD
jgi:hypothetical protein